MYKHATMYVTLQSYMQNSAVHKISLHNTIHKCSLYKIYLRTYMHKLT